MNNQKYFVPEIQGLRAIAVLAVVLFHADIHLFSGGFVGVDVFFVISGFLITGLMLREYDKHHKINLIGFFARRLKRLLPASFFVTIVTMLVFSFIYSPFEIKMLTSSAIASLVYLSNIWFASISTDYLRGGADSDPFLHMWSLAVEEQFYLFWPLLVILAYKLIRNRVLFWQVFLPVVGLSFVLNAALINTHQPWAFFGAPTRAWEFGLGALCSVVVWKQSLKLGYVASLLGVIIGVLALGYATFFFDQYTLFPGYNALFPVVGTTLILLCITTGQATPFSLLLASRPARFIGDVSYSWYLWHWPAKVFAKEMFPDFAEIAVFISVLVAFVLAIMTTKYVEDPFRKFSNMKNSQTFLITIVFTALTLGAFGLIRMEAQSAAQQPLQKTFQEARTDLAGVYGADCHINYSDTDTVACQFGDRTATEAIVLFGDSHAAHWFAAVERFAIANKYRLITHTKNACPSYMLEPFDSNLGRSYYECTRWRNNVFAEIELLQPELVVISNFAGYWDSSALQGDIEGRVRDVYQQTFNKIAAPVIVIKDVGGAPYFIPKCLARSNQDELVDTTGCDFEFKEHEAFSQAEEAVTRATKQAFYVDLNEYICPGDVCPAMTGQRINYIDNHHISNELSKALGGPLIDEIGKLELTRK